MIILIINLINDRGPSAAARQARVRGGRKNQIKNQIIINKLINLKNLINYLLTVDSLGRALSKHFLTVPVACRPQHSVDEDPVKIDEYLHQRLVLYSHF